MDDGAPRGAATGRAAWFVHELVSPTGLGGFALAIAVTGIVASGSRYPHLAAVLGPIGVALVVLFAWRRASETAADAFFVEFAPTIGLRYVNEWALPTGTPLLAAGDRRHAEHAMVGPLFGADGGPECALCHYTYELQTEATDSSGVSASVSDAHRFTVCRVELHDAMPSLRSVYLRRRQRGVRLPGTRSSDWLSGWSTEQVEMESAEFERLYELHVGPDQDRLLVSQLFSPSLVLWLAEHPLRPGFEWRAGTLAVYVPGREGDPARLTELQEAAREIARRISGAVASAPDHFSAAGQTIR